MSSLETSQVRVMRLEALPASLLSSLDGRDAALWVLENRVSVSLTDEQLTARESLAQDRQAAVSWMVRRAVAEYLVRNCRSATNDGGRTAHAPVAGK